VRRVYILRRNPVELVATGFLLFFQRTGFIGLIVLVLSQVCHGRHLFGLTLLHLQISLVNLLDVLFVDVSRIVILLHLHCLGLTEFEFSRFHFALLVASPHMVGTRSVYRIQCLLSVYLLGHRLILLSLRGFGIMMQFIIGSV
jgi:hypothetical protein